MMHIFFFFLQSMAVKCCSSLVLLSRLLADIHNSDMPGTQIFLSKPVKQSYPIGTGPVKHHHLEGKGNLEL